MGQLLRNKVVGIIGFGRIGKTVAGIAKAFGAKLLVYDIVNHNNFAGVSFVPQEEIFAQADIISLHLSSDNVNEPVINAKTVASMKNGSYLINTSRGNMVDEDILYEALSSGKLSGAGLDVFCSEPYSGKLMGLDNIVVTTHIGSYARESRISMEIQAVENLLKGLKVKI